MHDEGKKCWLWCRKVEKWNDPSKIWTRDLQHRGQVSLPLHHGFIRKFGKKIKSHHSVHCCGKKLLILKAGNSNKEKFKSSKAPKVHIFQALSKKTFELTSQDLKLPWYHQAPFIAKVANPLVLMDKQGGQNGCFSTKKYHFWISCHGWL